MSRDALSPALPEVFAAAGPSLAPELPPEVFALGGPRPTRSPRAPAAAGVPGGLRPGTIIDKYRIEELLGVGGFAAVYRATHSRVMGKSPN